jgi:cobalamin biosynthesis protein CobC
MASRVNSTAMGSHPDCGTDAGLPHGGDLALARRLFPGAPEPFIDLSTGINPNAYPVPALRIETYVQLPQSDELAKLLAIAARHYSAPSDAHVVAAPGSQMLLPHIARLVPPTRAAILGPTYAEHRRAAAAAGHEVEEVTQIAALRGCPLAIIVNPNNPDGRLLRKALLLELAHESHRQGGLCVVDEAFMDALSGEESLAAEVARGGIVVLRSFGKFFGLAGLRLGFALADPGIVQRLRDALGPWAIAGPAITIGAAAMEDHLWIAAARTRLALGASRLDALLRGAGLDVVGGTPLFRLVRTPRGSELFQRLGQVGILVRYFPEQPNLLRFGQPGSEEHWERLRRVLSDCDRTCARPVIPPAL